MTQQHRYVSYLLRLWKDSDTTSWRASLQPVPSDERLGFPNLEALFAFLLKETDTGGPPAEEDLDTEL